MVTLSLGHKKYHNVGESEKYLYDEDMEDRDIQTKVNEEDEEEPTGINETNEQAATGLDKNADHNIELATIFLKSEFATRSKSKLLHIVFNYYNQLIHELAIKR